MGKKYVPSGYQIVNIDITGLATGDELLEDSGDVDIVKNYFKTNAKPLLLTITKNGNIHASGFATRIADSIVLEKIEYVEGVFDNLSSYIISLELNDDSDEILRIYFEEM